MRRDGLCCHRKKNCGLNWIANNDSYWVKLSPLVRSTDGPGSHRRFDASKPRPNSAVSRSASRGRSFVPYFARSAPACSNSTMCPSNFPASADLHHVHQPEGGAAWLPESVRGTAPAIRRKPPEAPEHPSLWLFFSSQAPHIIETMPLENRRQVGTVDS
jgi:hypothetical protein